MKDKDFQDKVLIKLNRKYGKDELVATKDKKISELEIELGKCKSYIDELEDSNKKLQREIAGYSEKNKVLLEGYDNTYMVIKRNNHEKRMKQIRDLQIDLVKLRTDNANLIYKLHQATKNED